MNQTKIGNESEQETLDKEEKQVKIKKMDEE